MASLMVASAPVVSDAFVQHAVYISTNELKEFAQGKVDPVEAGKKGGQTGGSAGGSSSGGSGGDDYKPTENDGLKKDGTPDQRVKGN